MKTKIIIATHKKYKMPNDAMYLPLHVGREGKQDLGYIGDNTGENISDKNANFCELTGLYWAWKNLDCEYLGLAHYRRHFTLKNKVHQHFKGKMESVLTKVEADTMLKVYPILVPKKRRYYIETIYSHYEHTHYKEHLDVTREIIAEKYPEYLDVFDTVMQQRSGYMFNMFIMRKDLADSYCEWLFQILFELEERFKGVNYSFFQGRFYGRVSEIIFNVWLLKQNVPYKEVPYMHIEKINWFKKGTAFLKAKFASEKYESSF